MPPRKRARTPRKKNLEISSIINERRNTAHTSDNKEKTRTISLKSKQKCVRENDKESDSENSKDGGSGRTDSPNKAKRAVFQDLDLHTESETHDSAEDGDREDEEEKEEREYELSDTAQVSKKTAKKKTTLEFDSDQEDDLVEFYLGHPELYDHSHKLYKRTDLKNRVLAEKAKEMGVLPGDIQTWYQTQRTAFTRLKSTKSGQAKKTLTSRSQWVVNKFSFLAKHLRVRTDVSSFPKLPDLPEDSSGDDTEEVGRFTEQLTQHTVPSPPKSKSPKSKSNKPGKSSKPSKAKFDTVLNTLAERLVNRDKDQSKLEATLKEGLDSRRTWATWLGGEVQEFSDEEWMGFHNEVGNSLYKYKRQLFQRRRSEALNVNNPSRPVGSTTTTLTPTGSLFQQSLFPANQGQQYPSGPSQQQYQPTQYFTQQSGQHPQSTQPYQTRQSSPEMYACSTNSNMSASDNVELDFGVQ